MSNRLPSITDANLSGKTVLVRADYNVPLTEDGQILDDLRIRASLPTINYLLTNGAKNVIITSHLGRPQGPDPKFSLAPVADRLQELLPNTPVNFASTTDFNNIAETAKNLPAGSILLLENLRFWPGEKANDQAFAQNIITSTGADLFVQDGFGVIHREAASTSAIAKLLPAFAGLLLEKEVSTLESAVENPAHPFVVIIGGAKVEDKAPLIQKFTPIADQILVGGKIAAEGYSSDNHKIYVAEDFSGPEKSDLGPLSTAKFLAEIKTAKTILWNGTLGLVDENHTSPSSIAVATALGRQPDATTIICGGDTTAFVENLLRQDPSLHFSLISTGGGASLSLLTGSPLPGLAALSRSNML